MIVSELAANTLHVRTAQQLGGPEMWLYLRGSGARRELVCKIFDCYPGWLSAAPHRGTARGAGKVPDDALRGRGLEVVHELTGGRWGYHLTRARLSGRTVRGKAVWFTMPVTVTGPEAARGGSLPGSATEAVSELGSALAARGFDTMVPADDQAGDMAVLSVCDGITVWCRSGSAWLRAAGTDGSRWSYADLVEIAEQTVEAHETLAGSAMGADGARIPPIAGVPEQVARVPEQVARIPGGIGVVSLANVYRTGT
jgi:hypothetical protein